MDSLEEEVATAVFDGLIEFEKVRPNAVAHVLTVMLPAIRAGAFNLYRPIDAAAWKVVHDPIMVAAEFEFMRLHLLALMYEKLMAHASDETVRDAEDLVSSILRVDEL